MTALQGIGLSTQQKVQPILNDVFLKLIHPWQWLNQKPFTHSKPLQETGNIPTMSDTLVGLDQKYV